MEGAVIIVFPHHGTNPEQMDSGPALKADDEQAVCYVAGYVAMALKKKYAKLPNDTTAVQYLDCLTIQCMNWMRRMTESCQGFWSILSCG